MTIDSLNIGDFKEIELKISRDEINNYAAVSGDYSPIHVDEEYASKTRFGGCLAHGMYLGAVISRIIGMEMPGEGTIYVSQNLNFKNPIYVDDVVKVRVSVKGIDLAINRVFLQTDCFGVDNNILIEGEGVVIPPLM